MSNRIETALLSVTDKRELASLATGLLTHNPAITLLASGGTARHLRDAGFNVTDISDYTGEPESFGGRVKTLHPKIAGGILYRRDIDHAEAEELGVQPIDLVVCNLYAFKEAATKELPIDKLIEEVDIGGVTLIRAAAKNYQSVAVLVDPQDYASFLDGLSSTLDRASLAVKAFNHTADYEATIAQVLSKSLTSEESYRLNLREGAELRYGENPDQKGWFYPNGSDGLGAAKLLSGKALSYNNLEDATAAYRAAVDLVNFTKQSGVAIVKHGNLCGYAVSDTVEEAFEGAWEGDSKSAFGSVIALTHLVDETSKRCFKGRFIEVVIAPSFSEEMVAWFQEKKPDTRLLEVSYEKGEELRVKSVSGGMLIQTEKRMGVTPWTSVTQKEPSDDEQELLHFAVLAVSHAKSNAIAITRRRGRGMQLLGIGAGQPNRVDSLERLAIPKALENLKREGSKASMLSFCALASDGFFPFADSVEAAARYGITLCAQPGGSKRDQEVISAANEAEMKMLFTNERYFTH